MTTKYAIETRTSSTPWEREASSDDYETRAAAEADAAKLEQTNDDGARIEYRVVEIERAESTRRYATIQVETRTVYGIGETEARAQADAAQNGMECTCDSRDEDCTHAHGQLLDGFATVPCTEAAVAYVQKHGGAPTSDLIVSARGVMLRSEER